MTDVPVLMEYGTQKMTIRPASSNDIPILAAIIREANQDVAKLLHLTPENAPKHPSNCTEEWIEAAFDKGITYYLLVHAGTPCGCVALEQASEEICYVERLAVLPAFRHQGFGEALVKHVFAEAQKFGATRVEIGTITEHTELNNWYQKLGFILKGTKQFDHLPFNITFMYKEV